MSLSSTINKFVFRSFSVRRTPSVFTPSKGGKKADSVSPFSKTGENKNGLKDKLPTLKAKSVFKIGFLTKRTRYVRFIFATGRSYFRASRRLIIR